VVLAAHARAREAGRRAAPPPCADSSSRGLGRALGRLTRCWPCESNSVRLGSSPRAQMRVGGLWAFGRGSSQQGQSRQSSPSNEEKLRRAVI
jgi:hypothetical protein